MVFLDSYWSMLEAFGGELHERPVAWRADGAETLEELRQRRGNPRARRGGYSAGRPLPLPIPSCFAALAGGRLTSMSF